MDPRGNKYFHYYPNLTVSDFFLKFYINIHILMHPSLLIKEAYFCSRLWLKEKINLVNTEQISDYNVKSLKWNTYTTPHVSRPRGHCRKGCKKSCESQRRGKCSKKKKCFLITTDKSQWWRLRGQDLYKKPNQPKSRLRIGSGTWCFLNEEESVLCKLAPVRPWMLL